MNNEEIQALMQKLQEAGLSPEDIADGILWPLFRDGKMSKEDLATLCSSIGLELDEEFENDKGPEGEGAPAPAAEGVSKEEAEDLKEIKPGESKEEFKEKVEEAKGPEGDGEPAPAAEEPKAEEPKAENEPAPAPEKSDDEEWDDVKKNIFKL